MKLNPEQIQLLGLSRKEIRVLDGLREGKNTPLLISRHAKITRPTVYVILARLHKRGISTSVIRNGKKYWVQVKDCDIEERLYETKKALLNFEDGRQEISGRSDSTVIVHRGAKAIQTLIGSMFSRHEKDRLYGIQGDVAAIGWDKIFGVEGTNEINRLIKKNGIIVDAVLPHGWFERQTKALGVGWAKDFEGRMTATHEIGEKYFRHGGQIFIFKKSLYLMAMNEEIVIEVRNSEIQKLILSMFRFIQDNSRKFDVNALLREIIVKKE